MKPREERRWLTDDRDLERRNSLRIYQGENGDWYVSVAPEHEKDMNKAVRICTNGGAQQHCPALVEAVYDMWIALGEFEENPAEPTKLDKDTRDILKEYEDAFQDVPARAKFVPEPGKHEGSTIMSMRPISPKEVLIEEFLKPLNMSTPELLGKEPAGLRQVHGCGTRTRSS